MYLQKVQGYMAPPIFAVFFLGLFIPRINGPGCMAGPDRRLHARHGPTGGRDLQGRC